MHSPTCRQLRKFLQPRRLSRAQGAQGGNNLRGAKGGPVGMRPAAPQLPTAAVRRDVEEDASSDLDWDAV